MNVTELERCWSYGEFRRNFHIIPVKPLNESELNFVLEKLISWHLSTKSFSSEYLSMVPYMVNATQRIFKIFSKASWLTNG
jgi:hypothetical protein